MIFVAVIEAVRKTVDMHYGKYSVGSYDGLVVGCFGFRRILVGMLVLCLVLCLVPHHGHHHLVHLRVQRCSVAVGTLAGNGLLGL